MKKNESSYDLHFDLAVNCYFIKHKGLFDLEALMTRSTIVFEHPLFQPSVNSLIDFSDSVMEISSEELAKAGSVARDRVKIRGKAKELLIVNNLFSFGVSREYMAHVASDVIVRKIVSSKDRFQIESVKSWLDLESTYSFPEFLNF
ncbi:hypothetical protein A9Q83_12465 [Alphaproteobacteria bacterium 46_93_T64]|nr:hypothetical protein A9Q83_12465 [Alphaproteobacteria bacterium 46_93_T64]